MLNPTCVEGVRDVKHSKTSRARTAVHLGRRAILPAIRRRTIDPHTGSIRRRPVFSKRCRGGARSRSSDGRETSASLPRTGATLPNQDRSEGNDGFRSAAFRQILHVRCQKHIRWMLDFHLSIMLTPSRCHTELSCDAASRARARRGDRGANGARRCPGPAAPGPS
jgi:hypothetical protein